MPPWLITSPTNAKHPWSHPKGHHKEQIAQLATTAASPTSHSRATAALMVFGPTRLGRRAYEELVHARLRRYRPGDLERSPVELGRTFILEAEGARAHGAAHIMTTAHDVRHPPRSTVNRLRTAGVRLFEETTVPQLSRLEASRRRR